MPTRPVDQRFQGRITGLGSTSGVRVVVGWWPSSDWPPFADVMIEEPGGHRVLLAPDQRVAELLEGTYTFDEIVIGPVTAVIDDDSWLVNGPDLELRFTVGRRSGIGRLLRLVPRRLATHPRWLTLINPAARLIMRGVQTAGTAGGGRREYYGAYDVRGIAALQGTWRGTDLGRLAPVDPPVRFGFGSAPRTPAITDLITTIRQR